MTDTQSARPRTRAKEAGSQTFGRDDRARAGLPSRAQLLTLVDVAEQRMLTPREVYLLRLGVTHLASQLEAAGGRLRAVEAERDAAVRRVDEVRVEVGSPLVVPCAYCGAAVGERCVSRVNGMVQVTAHTARLDALRRRLEVAS